MTQMIVRMTMHSDDTDSLFATLQLTHCNSKMLLEPSDF